MRDVALLVSFVLCLGESAAASTSTSTSTSTATFELSGRVLDETGVELAGATLTLLHESTGLTRTTTTNAAGRYTFAGLPAGSYTLEARLAGYATSRFAGLRYFADTKPIFNITLRLREVQESMTFTGEAPLINSSQSQLGLSVDPRQLRDLPLRRRDYLDLVAVEGSAMEIEESTPGERVAAAPRATVNGQSPVYTAYQLDGFRNTRDQHGVPLTDVSVDAVEEFRVIASQFSAEYGPSLAGIVSAVTASGANDVHGSLFAAIRPGSWDADDPLTGWETALDRQDVGFTFSGPLVRERALLFAALEYRNEDEEVAVTAPFGGGSFRGLAKLPAERVRAVLKLSQVLGASHRLTVKGLFSEDSASEGVGGFDVSANALDVDDDDVAIQGTLVSEIGSIFSELRAGLAAERFRAAAGPPPAGGPALRHPLLGNIGNPLRYERADETHLEISETLSIPRGSHGLKAGFGLLHIESESELVRYPEGLVFFAPTDRLEPILAWRSVAPPGGDPVVRRGETHLSVFVQDDWQLTPYVTLNLGLRWDDETSVPDRDNLGPRLGLHWDATKDGRSSVRGGYGMFYGSLFSVVDTLERLYGPSGRRFLAAPGGAPPDPAGELVPANLYVDAPRHAAASRSAPYAHHFTLGVERELLPSLSASLDVSHVRGEDLVLPTDVNAPAFFDYAAGGDRPAAAADRARPLGVPGRALPPGAVPAFPEGLPFGGYRDLYLLDSRGSSRYWGVRLNFTKRYGNDFMLQAVYHWSRARNDGDDIRVEHSLPLDPGRPEREWARAATDVPHALVANGVWNAPWGLRLTGLVRARSGRPVDPELGLDRDGDLKLLERAVRSGRILERNSFRARPFASLDLSVSKSWELGEARSLEASFEVFNVTNRLNPRQVLPTYGPLERPLDAFLSVVEAGAPRQVQLSLRWRF